MWRLALAIASVVVFALALKYGHVLAPQPRSDAREGGAGSGRRAAIEMIGRHALGCPLPQGRAFRQSEVEAADRHRWTAAAGSSDRLLTDPCGTVWGLWFNSWAVHPDGDPQTLMHFGPLYAQGLRYGVKAWLATRDGELWTAGDQAQLHRVRANGVSALTMPAGCGPRKALVEFDGAVWLGCEGLTGDLFRFDREREHWVPARPQSKLPTTAMLVSEHGRLYVGGPGGIDEVSSGASITVRRVSDAIASPDYLAVDGDTLFAAAGTVLITVDLAGARPPVRHVLPNAITGLVARPGGKAWASQRMAGVRHFDGARWHHWTHATGLPDNDGRALLLDGKGRLWLGGTPTAVIDVEAAEAQVVRLQMPVPIPGERHADACAAATARLTAGQRSGGFHLHLLPEPLVIADGRTWCPDSKHAPADAGMLVASNDGRFVARFAYNGLRSSRTCGMPCEGERAEQIAALWRATLSEIASDGSVRTRALPTPAPPPRSSPAMALVDRKGRLIVGTRDEGIHRFDGRSWTRLAPTTGWHDASVFRPHIEDHAGGVWIAVHTTRREVPVLYRLADDDWQAWTGDQLGSGWIRALAVTADGVIATGNGGLVRIRPLAGVQVERGDGLPEVERIERPRGGAEIAIDRSGRIWLAYLHDQPGIAMVDARGEVHPLTGRDGLFAEHIARLAFDGEDRMWLQAVDGSVGIYELAALEGALAGRTHAVDLETAAGQ